MKDVTTRRLPTFKRLPRPEIPLSHRRGGVCCMRSVSMPRFHAAVETSVTPLRCKDAFSAVPPTSVSRIPLKVQNHVQYVGTCIV